MANQQEAVKEPLRRREGQIRKSEAPPQGHKVRKFDKCIYKLSLTLSEIKTLSSQQIKWFLSEETDY